MMLCSLIKKDVYNVEFIPESENASSDIKLNGINIEIKTIHDDPLEKTKLEDSLAMEIQETIKREKIEKIINKALEQKAGIIILVLTGTSIGNKFLEYSYKSNFGKHFSLF